LGGHALVGSGRYDAQTKTIEERGRINHPLVEKAKSYRSNLEFVGENTYKRTIFLAPRFGKERKLIEVTFERGL
jgi:hypothetical protein